ncbi:hypothetical protein U1769_24845, partial [Sphingomonas sp. ZT3P38]|uniref:GNAT family N-acetyltransferase n=1 Tax=Parasphingomonas zepuensis TaxID=3096161 RepID=UPI003B73FE58
MNAAVAIDTVNARPASPDLRLHVQPPSAEITPLGAIAPAFAADWDDLAANAAEPNVFAERWFIAASAPLHPMSGVRQIAVRADNRLIGILHVAQATHYGRLPIAHVENWLHYHSFLGGPLLRRGYEQAAWTAILEALDADRHATGLLHFTGLVEHGPVHHGLLAATGALGRPCPTGHRIDRALLDSDRSPEAYYTTTVRKKKRKELGRLQSRLAELGKVTTHRLSDINQLPAW